MISDNETSQLNREDWVTYKEAASIIGVSEATINRAAGIGVLTTAKLGVGHAKFIPRYEVEALIGMPVLAKSTQAVLDKVRHDRRMAMSEKEYVEDGSSPEKWISEGDIKDVLVLIQALEITLGKQSQIIEQQNRIIEEQSEFLKGIRERGEFLLSLSPEEMIKAIVDATIERRAVNK